jgi:uncharacterized protein (DUF433 family)
MRHERIEINPEIMFGKPVIKGTRITVELLLRKLAGGMTIDEIIEDHPHLETADIYAATAFAADHLAQEEIIFTEDKDFGELVYRLRLPAQGIFLLRFAINERQLKIPRLLELLDSEGHRLPGSFIVLEADKTRLRPLR